ncbi:aldehyde dehydrogenase 3H1 [Sodiomyces alkalinus F11]|uniref:Aldehyde dehydrogenase n=1 Tax=Sodiomyces alkalinus (strain CBS 110278 / VKM F-3762 / F11) TaxID=1314773 RepID=A0A3N2PMA5_SODAK|nr:aldehyde dehydrogenase 3H1 [Sodiomyces alkalinus F11]ROT35643.1 aldehyde dehydrogenase 3H1 [Sodiomyces alkalinus F11]
MATPVDLKIPDFENTSMEDISRVTDTLRATFRSSKTKDLQWRLVQLRKLYWAIKDYTPALCNALRADLRKSKHEALLSEIDWVANDCIFLSKNLERFAKDEPGEDVPLTFVFMRPHVRKEPLGMVLIIGAFNFPVQLVLTPLIGAIAAGCTAVVKPSENAPHTAMVIKKLVETALDPSAFSVVNGAIPETQALMDIKWDKVMYTGSTHVAKIISQKAAETLTPVCLELGGINPAFVTRHADVKLAARRLAWSKTLNAGQVCLSQNYVLADRTIVPQLITAFKESYKRFFPSGAKNSPDLSRIVNQRQFQRIKKLLDSTRGKIVMGGATDEASLFIEPTIVQVDSIDDPVICEETFGPVFAILPYDTLDEAINSANQLCDTPLALFVFGNEEESKKVLGSVTSGGATINDGYTHASIPTLPLGGIGSSGTGSYRGRASFEVFTHRRSVAVVPAWVDKLLRVRYMPYSPKELARLRSMSALRCDFDRAGRPIRGLRYWLVLVLGLGSPTFKGALFRWAVALAGVFVARQRGLLDFIGN